MDTIKRPILTALLIFTLCASAFSDGKSEMRGLLEEAEKAYDDALYPQSEALCNTIIESYPNAYPAYNLLGMIYAAKDGQQGRAISYLERSLAISPKQTAVYNAIGSIYNQMGQPDDAIAYLEKGMKREPDNYELNFNMGMTYLVSKRDANKAIGYFMEARKKKPENDKLEYLIGLSYFVKGDNSMALDSVTRLRHLNNEYLASSLEEHMRKAADGKAADMTNAIRSSIPEAPIPRAPAAGPDANVRKPKTTVNATGELIVKTQSQKPPEPKDKEDASGLSN